MSDTGVVLFDVGGTLVEVSPSVGHIYASACAERGADVEPDAVQRAFDLAWVTLSAEVPPGADRYRLYAGGEREWWERVSALAFDHCDVRRDSRPPVEQLRAVFATAQAWRVFPETREALSSLRRRGFRLGVLSNWDSRLPSLLATLGLRDQFEAVIYSAQVGVEKPHPAIFAAALSALGVEAAAAVHVGDRLEEDYTGARAAGLRALLVSRRSGGVDGSREAAFAGMTGMTGEEPDVVFDLGEVVRRIAG